MIDALRSLALRTPWSERQPAGVSTRALIALAASCVAVFGCFFLIGRAAVPARAPQLQETSGLALTYSGAAIPAGLTSVPSIETIAFSPATTRRPPTTSTHAPASTNAAPPAAETPSVAPTVEAPATVAPVTAPRPAPSAPAKPAPHHSSAGVPFDSSG